MINPRQRISWLIPIIVSGVLLSGCGVAAAKTLSPMKSGSSRTSVAMAGNSSSSGGSLIGVPSDLLVGAAASPPSGPGNGQLLITSMGTGHTLKLPLSTGANAFTLAIDKNMVYVPTLQGTTYVVSLLSHKIIQQFATTPGARIANIGRENNVLLVTGPNNVTAYSLSTLHQLWQTTVGGNALSVVGSHAYLSSNLMSSTLEIDLATGRIVNTIPVGHIEDSVYDSARHTLWLANWSTGDMTIVDTLTNTVLKVIHETGGGGFSVANMMSSPGGFMQITVGPRGQHVYAASFSGNIMVYDALTNTFDKNIPVDIPMAKLSGIAIDPSDQYAYTTVESHQETVSISLKTDKIVSIATGMLSNRWFVISR
ncbi:MAG: hypothetical protein C7B46_06705 [Sulfobacillus benefaciens]|uniref:YncE family protein n=1 Tax=Sulfobacillus benefaciens TaxID=453960 RepID=A0A2T2XHZ2_9FIRM|nr:MAG: hypothetical protein C7B46_06705 [Sulfobacillus benefaciens]